MDPAVILLVLAASFLAGLCTLGVMASRIDNARRFADLIRDTRRIRLEHVGVAPQRPARRR